MSAPGLERASTVVADRYAVLGHPIAHSRSPFIHDSFARQTGQNLRYEAIDVPPADLRRRVQDFFQGGGRGLNLTVPHKESAVALADTLTERARRAGAVNTLAAIDGAVLGDNTDGAGLLRDLQINLRLQIEERRILLLGAGGAARGVLAPLVAQKPSALCIANRTHSRAVQLAAEFGLTAPSPPVLAQQAKFDLIINATAAGLAGQAPVLPLAVIGRDTVCYDMLYGTQDTPFMRWAHACGARAHMGVGMLVEQAAEAFEIWRGVRPDTAPVLAALWREMGR